MKRLGTIFSLLMFCVVAFTQTQNIGNFPFMQGGFENQTLGNAPVYSAVPTTTYTVSSASATLAIQNAQVRSGSKAGLYTSGGPSTFAYTPSTVGISYGNAYVVQFYAKYRFGTTVYPTVAVSAAGTAFGVVTPFYFSQANWIKYQNVIYPSNVPAGNGLLEFGNLMTGESNNYYIDDICLYRGNSIDVVAPNQVSAPVATPSNHQVVLSWAIPAGGIDEGGYMVVRGTAFPNYTPNVNGIYGVGNTLGNGQVAYIGNANSFTDTGLTNGTTYYYSIYAVDKAFNYSTGIIVSGTPCVPPNILTVTGGGSLCTTVPPIGVTVNPIQAGVSYILNRNGDFYGSGGGINGVPLTWYINEPGTYTVSTFNSGGFCAANMNGSVTVVSNYPSIVSQNTPAQNLCTNVAATAMSVTATGSGTLSYQWYSSTDAANNTPADDVTVGTNSNTYTPPTSVNGTKYYYCVVRNTCPTGTKTLSSAVSGAITVSAPPSFSIYTGMTSVCPTQYTSIQAIANGASSYQWQYSANGTTWANVANGTPVGITYNNATTSLLRVNAFTGVQPGTYYYHCIATGACSTTSSTAQLIVRTPPTIVSHLIAPNTLCEGEAITTVNATPTVIAGNGSTITSTTWQIKPYSGSATNITLPYTVSSVYNNATISYRVDYTCSANSGSISGSITDAYSPPLTVNNLPNITVQPASGSQTLCQYAPANQLNIQAAAGSGTISAYEWYSNPANSNSGGSQVALHTTAATTDSYTPATAATGTLYYYCKVKNSALCSKNSTVHGPVKVLPLSPNMTIYHH